MAEFMLCPSRCLSVSLGASAVSSICLPGSISPSWVCPWVRLVHRPSQGLDRVLPTSAPSHPCLSLSLPVTGSWVWAPFPWRAAGRESTAPSRTLCELAAPATCRRPCWASTCRARGSCASPRSTCAARGEARMPACACPQGRGQGKAPWGLGVGEGRCAWCCPGATPRTVRAMWKTS